jgi:arylsulfatase A-like enzyme
VNPHAPYTPPPPFDRAFVDGDAARGPVLAPVDEFDGGVHKPWAIPGRALGYYVAQYDGEIAAADQEVGRVLEVLDQGPAGAHTLVVLMSDHGESLGEHDYYFDHGKDLFDPCLRIPLIVRMPGGRVGVRSTALASTLDVLPTVLDLANVSYPPNLAGRSLREEIYAREGRRRDRLFAENARNLVGTLDERWKAVATPGEEESRYALFDRKSDPGETHDLAREQPDVLRVQRREIEIFQDRWQKEWALTYPRTLGQAAEQPPTSAGCELLKAMGYPDNGCR